MKTGCEVFGETVSKFDDLLGELRDCVTCEDFDRADRALELLRSYKACFYCVNYRKVLEGRSDYRGVCGACPLHAHGERLEGRAVLYNGCYKIGVYRNLIKTAFWFRSDRSMDSLKAAIKCLEDSRAYLLSIRDEMLST